MRCLVDTQALIWFAENNPKLSDLAKRLIEDSGNEIFVSQFSYVEIATKIAVQKLTLKKGLLSLMDECQNQRIITLTVQNSHLLAYNDIPLLENHRDSFDRMIIVTAIVEDLSIITSDEKFNWYLDLVRVTW